MTQELIERALKLRDAGEFGRAAEVFLHAFRAAPTDWRFPNEAGVCLQQAGRHAEAAALYEQALPLAPDKPFVLFNIGLARVQAGELDGAQRAFESVLAVDPQNIKAAFELGFIAMKRGAWPDAIALFDQAIAFDVLHNGANWSGSPGMDRQLHARVFLNKARIHGLELGQLDDARRQLALLLDLGDKGRVYTFATEAQARGATAAARAAAQLLIGDYHAHREVRELCDRLGVAP
jgi:tetratricopeptide (TPR) repeat protein